MLVSQEVAFHAKTQCWPFPKVLACRTALAQEGRVKLGEMPRLPKLFQVLRVQVLLSQCVCPTERVNILELREIQKPFLMTKQPLHLSWMQSNVLGTVSLVMSQMD